ncbi:hypothetical protein [Ekhidna sp.]|uniref:hypothetical protein n=1 Tax=Ekhidna sp. TaxID=2608089 RepID=UPI003B5B2FAE
MKKLYIYLLLILLASISVYVFQQIVVTDTLLSDHLSQQLSFNRIEQLLEFRDKWSWVNYAILPIIYLLKFTFISLWILSGIILFGYKTSFKKIFQVVLVAEFVWIVPSLLTIIWFGLIDTDYTLVDVQYFQPLSLMNFFDGELVESWLVFPLKALNLFEVAYMLVLAIGIKKVINRDYNTSLGFVVPVYGLGLVTWIVFITFLSINLSA